MKFPFLSLKSSASLRYDPNNDKGSLGEDIFSTIISVPRVSTNTGNATDRWQFTFNLKCVFTQKMQALFSTNFNVKFKDVGLNFLNQLKPKF